MMHEKTVQFLEFCGRQEPTERYNWEDSGCCALGKFNGYESKGWHADFDLCNEIAALKPWTFGALSQRLEQFHEYAERFRD